MSHSQPNVPLLLNEMSEKFKHPLDTINRLQYMEVLDEKPPLPTIIVLGEESASAGSVIGTLVGLNLPSDLGVTTILTFKTDSVCSPNIWLEFQFEDSNCKKQVCKPLLASEIAELVKPIPENRRSGLEVKLTVNQRLQLYDDLTVVLLPEIHTHLDMVKERKEIELFDGYIRRHNTSSNCLFLNVLACSSNFNSCISGKVLQRHDYVGNNTITIFTKLDLSSEYLIAQLISGEIETHFGYFFVEDGQTTKEECGLLSKVDKDHIGFDAISKNIVIAMLSIVFSPWSIILERIEADLKESAVHIKECQKVFDSVSDAVPVMYSILNSATDYLYELFITKEYYGKYRKDEHMHAAYNMQREFKRFRTDLQDLKLDNNMPFLQFEIEMIGPSVFASPYVIKALLNRQFSYASTIINNFVLSIMGYIKRVVVRVFLDCAENNLQLHQSLKQIARVLVDGVRKSYAKKLEEMLDLERKSHYTCNDDFDRKMNEIRSVKLELGDGKEFTSIEGLGKHIRVDHLKNYHVYHIERAFELKKSAVVYWEFVVNRFVDYCVLNLQCLIKEMISHGISRMIGENLKTCINDDSELPNVEPILTIKKANLESRIEYLIQAKKDIEKWKGEDF